MKMFGLDKDSYNKLASEHSKANILLWVLGGLAFNFYVGNLISISTILLVLPGIFIISFVSILTFYINQVKNKSVAATNNPFILLFWTAWMIIDFVFPILLGVLFVYFVTSI